MTKPLYKVGDRIWYIGGIGQMKQAQVVYVYGSREHYAYMARPVRSDGDLDDMAVALKEEDAYQVINQ